MPDNNFPRLSDLYEKNKEDSIIQKQNNPADYQRLNLESEATQGNPYLAGLPNRTPELHTTSGSGDFSFLPWEGVNNEQIRAENQSIPELAGKAAIQAGSELALGTLEGAGYLLDVPGIVNSIGQGEKEFGNWFSDLMKQGQEYVSEEVAPIYKTEAAQGFAPWDATWWASNAPQIVSAVSLAIPAGGLVKGLSAGARAAGLSSKISKGAKLGMKGVTGAVVSRYAENTMEAAEAMQSLTKQLEQERAAGLNDYSDAEIREASAVAAQDTWNKNWANLITDIPQYIGMFKGFNPTRAAVKESVLKNMGMEGLEEGTQYVMSKEAQLKGRESLGESIDSSFQQRLAGYITDPEFLTSTAFGALGGGAFGMIGNRQVEQAQKANAQNRAAAFSDPKSFYDYRDDAFTELAVKHAKNGTLSKLEDEIKIIGKDTQDSDLSSNNITSEGFQSKVQDRLADLKFVEDTYTSLWNNSRKSETLKAAELDQRIQQRLKEKRLVGLNTEINQLQNQATVALGLSPTLMQLKKLKLEVTALQDVKELKNTLLQKQKDLSNLYIQAKKETGAKTNADIDKAISSSNDASLTSKMSDKYKLDYELGKIKDNIEVLNTPKGEAKIDEAKVKHQEQLADTYIQSVLKNSPNKETALSLFNTALQDPNIAASEVLTRKIKGAINNINKEVKVAEIKEQKTNVETKPATIEEVKESKLTPTDVKNLNEEFSKLATPVQIDEANPDESLKQLVEDNPQLQDIVDDYNKSIIDTKQAIEEPVDNSEVDIIEPDSNIEAEDLDQPALHKGDFGNKIAYFDKGDVSQWWKSNPDQLEIGTEIDLVYEDNEQAREAAIANHAEKNDLTIEDVRIYTNTRPEMINPIKMIERSTGRLIGYLPAIYTIPEQKKYKALAEVRNNMSEGIKYTTTIGEKGPGTFNTVPNKNFGNNKEEKLSETLQSPNSDFYLGYGKGMSITVPNNDLLDNAISSSKATDGALYVIVRAADKTVKPARALLRDLNPGEVDYILSILAKTNSTNYQRSLKNISDVTFAGKNSGKNDPTLYFNLNEEGVVFYNPISKAQELVSYGSQDTLGIRANLSNKRRRVDAKKINDFTPYTDPVTGKTYNKGYNEFLSEEYVVTSDLVVGAPFRQAALYFTPPSKVTDKVEETVETKIEEKPKPKGRGASKLNPIRRSEASKVDKNYKVWNKTQELAWFKKNLPQVDISVLDNIKEVYSNGGKDMWGLFANSMVYIKTNAIEGTTFHEAFHAVFNLFLNEQQQNDIIKEAKSRYGLKTTDVETIEEKLAEEFKAYVAASGTNKSLKGKIKDFFYKLYQTLKHIIDPKISLDDLFYRINTGIYARNKKLSVKGLEPIRTSLHPALSIPLQKAAMDTLTYRFFEALENISVQSGSNLDYIDILQDKQYPIDSVYNQVILDIVSEEGYDESSPINLVLDNMEDVTNDQGEVIVEGLKNKHKRYLAFYGYDLRTKVADKDEYNKIFETTEEEQDKERWMFHYFEVSGIDKLSTRMRRFIGLAREYDRKTGEIKLNEFGEFQVVDMYQTYSFLVRNLANILTFDEMVEELAELININPSITDIYEKLVASPDEFKNEFFTNFSKQNLKFVSVTYKVIYEEENEDTKKEDRVVKYVDTRIFDSNRKSLRTVIFNDWYENFKNVALVYGKNNKEIIKREVIDEFKNSFEELKTMLNSNKAFSNDIAKKASDTFKIIGIDTPVDSYAHFFNDTVVDGIKVTGLANFKNKILGVNSPTLENIVHFLNKGQNIFLEEPNSINTFINQVINFEKTLTEDSFKNVEGKTVYSFTNNNYMSKTVSAIKGKNYKSFLAPYMKTAFNAGSIWLQKLMNSPIRQEFDIFTLDGLRQDENGNTGVKFKDMTAKEALVTKINMFLNQGRNFAYYQMATPADNPLLSFIKFDRVDNAKLLDSVINSIVIPEYNRIKEATAQIDKVIALKEANDPTWKDEENKLVKNYHWSKYDNKLAKDGNAFKLQYLVSDKLSSYIGKELLPVDLKAIRSEVKSILAKGVNELKQDLLNKGIIEMQLDWHNKPILVNKSLDSKGITKLDSRNGTNPVINALSSYYINSLIATAEITRLGIGDIAFYKKDKSGLTTIDASKRTTELTTPGDDGNTEGAQNYRMVVLKTKEIDTPLYKDVDETDAQGYMTLPRYLDILKRHGRWSSKIEKAVADLESGNPTQESLSILLNPIKGFNYGHRYENGMVIPTQIKYSTIPLIPELTKNRPELEKLRLAMEANGIDEAIWDTAIKVGAQTILDFDYFTGNQITESEKYVMKNSDWRWVQNVPEHHLDSDNLFGTQIRRLIMGNIVEDAEYTVDGFDKPFTGKELKDFYQNIIVDNVNESLNDVLKRFSSTKELQKALMSEVQSRKLGEQYEKALQLRPDGSLVIPPTMTKKFESILMSLFKNGVMKQRIKGITAVQVSKFGFEDLKFVSNEDGKITEAECLLPWWSEKYFPKLPNGEVDFTAIPDELKKIVGYRIPTEGKHSMLPMKVVGFLPKESGSIVVLPSEITKQMGSDFDVDKMFIMLPEWDENLNKVKYDNSVGIGENSRAAKDNALIDIIRGVLLNPNSFDAMTKPGGFDYLKELAYQVLEFEGTSATKRSYVDPNTQEYLRQVNQAGSQLIGLAANHNTNHVLAVDSDFKLAKGVVVFTKEDGEMVEGRGLYYEKDIYGDLISSQLGEFLAAFVDNAKDPVASHLNINMFTFGVAALIVRTGFGLKTSSYFLSQPILKDFMNIYNNLDKSLSNSKKTSITVKQLLKAYNVPDAFDPDRVYPFSTLELEQGLKATNKNEAFKRGQLNVLSTFINYKKLASGLQGAVAATRADALGLYPTLTGNRLYIEKAKASIEDYATVNTINVFKANSTYPMVKAFTRAISVANENVGKYIPWDTASMNKVRRDITFNTNKDPEEKELERINYNAMTYMMSNFEWLKMQENRRKDLLTGDKALINRILELKKNEEYADNYFLRLLKAGDINNGIKYINFTTPIDKTGIEREMVIDSWNSLLLSDDAEVKAIAQDLVLYSFLTSGLAKTRNSFFDYIPFDYLDDTGYINYYAKVKANLANGDYLNTFTKQFLQNNYNSEYVPTAAIENTIEHKGKAESPDVFVTNLEKGGSFVIERDEAEGITKWSVIVKFGDSLYELSQGNESVAVYKKTNKLGDGTNNLVEYSFDDNNLKSIIESNNVSVKDNVNIGNYIEQLAKSLENIENMPTFEEGSIEKLFNDNKEVLMKANSDITLEQLQQLEQEFGREFVEEYIKKCKGI